MVLYYCIRYMYTRYSCIYLLIKNWVFKSSFWNTHGHIILSVSKILKKYLCLLFECLSKCLSLLYSLKYIFIYTVLVYVIKTYYYMFFFKNKMRITFSVFTGPFNRILFHCMNNIVIYFRQTLN